MSGEQNNHEKFARAYMRALLDYEQSSYFGNTAKRDDAIDRKKDLERGVRVIVDNPRVLE